MKAYLILDLAVHDFGRFREYIERVPAFLEKHGARYIVQGAEATPMEGDWHPERIVVLEFPARESAKEFLSDPDYQELLEIRLQTTTVKMVLVDGCF
ncbi:DUF1330 domain-containing protein [uncultured Maricaulis sp.]|uniref:DUF1330 domain-containing protein n=1 Tax=uncultured Maricaulis sp. TaxID=174710 RepID=UPI0030D794AF|tara:strand:+ start:30625 stop:30915 length:291 start_codon:yes stop_codon:yes gene_type:complete